MSKSSKTFKPADKLRKVNTTGYSLSGEPGLEKSFSPSDIRLADELVTLLVGLAIYSLWFFLTFNFHNLPLPLVFIAGGFVICWFGSFQHETIHGHPFKNQKFNSALAYLPLGLVFPYSIYKQTHIKHHETSDLTDPLDDPESFYFTSSNWEAKSKTARLLYNFNNTLTGRLLIGPVLSIYLFLKSEIQMLVRGDRSHLNDWLVHIFAVSVVMSWVSFICGISLFQYLAFFIYPGTALSLVRSYTEHKPALNNDESNAIVESNLPFQLVFLNNNFHYVHHKLPWLPWYKIPFAYQNHKDEVLKANGGFYFKGYGEILKRFAFKPKDSPVFPPRSKSPGIQ